MGLHIQLTLYKVGRPKGVAAISRRRLREMGNQPINGMGGAGLEGYGEDATTHLPLGASTTLIAIRAIAAWNSVRPQGIDPKAFAV